MRIVTALTVLCIAAGAARWASAATDATPPPLSAVEADEIAQRTADAALVVVAYPVKVRDSGMAECRVVSVLKGKYDDLTFRVRFVKVLGGVWPETGVTAVYFLKPPVVRGASNRKTVFGLVSDKKGLAPPTEPLIAVVRLAAAGKYVRSAERRRATIKLPPHESKLGTMLSAEYVAIGTVEEVHLSTRPLVAARLSCRLETVFKGKLQAGRVEIAVPKALALASDPNRKPLAVKAGPAVLMFVRARNKDTYGEFRMVSPYRGWFAIPQREAVADEARRIAGLVSEEKDLRRRGLIGDPAWRTSIPKTLQLWQTSWNAKEVQNVVSCYSQKSKWRRLWESGDKGKREIAKTIEEYPGRFYVSREGVAERKAACEMQVTVSINVITDDQLVERRPAVMTFVYENGMWLILHEGT